MKKYIAHLLKEYGKNKSIDLLSNAIKDLSDYPTDNINQIVFFSTALLKIKNQF